MNGKVVRYLAYLLVLVTVVAVVLMMAYMAGTTGDILMGFQIFVLGTGLSALTLAVLARDSRPQGAL